MPVYEEKDKVNGQKRWFIRTYITDENGTKKQVTKHNKDWLGRDGYWLAQQEENILRNKKYIVNKKILLNDAIKRYISDVSLVNKESTCYSYNNIIKINIIPFFKGNYNLTNLNSKEIISWHKWLLDKNKYKITYLQKCHTVLSEILRNEIKYENIDINYAKNVGNFENKAIDKEKVIYDTQKIRYITYEQFKTFIENIDDIFWKTFFSILYYTGMRVGEVQALTWKDVDLKNKTIIVNKTLTTKTNAGAWKITSTKNLKNRVIAIDNNLNKLLEEFYISQINIFPNKFVFGDKENEPLKEHRIKYNKCHFFQLSGIDEITNHEFRHSHVSLLINEYLKLGQTDTTKFFELLSKRLGHSVETMRETYMHLFPNFQYQIVNIIDALNLKQDQKQDQKLKFVIK